MLNYHCGIVSAHICISFGGVWPKRWFHLWWPVRVPGNLLCCRGSAGRSNFQSCSASFSSSLPFLWSL